MKHVYHDGHGEVRIYAALPGCSCAWCESQRHPSTKPHKARHAEPLTPEHVGAQLDARAQQIAKRDGLKYLDAFKLACKECPDLAEYYAEQMNAEVSSATRDYSDMGGTHGATLADQQQRQADAGTQLDAIAQRILKDNPHLGYEECFHKACSQNPALADAYHGYRSRSPA